MLWHLAPSGVASFVLANGSMSTSTTSEAEIRKNLLEKDNVDCIVTMPGQLFYSTQIPVCLWFITRNKAAKGHRDRRGEILFIDARKMGQMVEPIESFQLKRKKICRYIPCLAGRKGRRRI